jgi:hypothetical protein
LPTPEAIAEAVALLEQARTAADPAPLVERARRLLGNP